MTSQQTTILTIGHSTLSIDAFIEALKLHAVTAVADVRSAPFSRFNPQFNKDALQQSLKAAGIRYVFLGKELGARSSDPSCYENGRVRYGRLARTELFQSGIERVKQGAETHRIALMCAEKEPLDCHRTILVARELVRQGVAVHHILANGALEPHAATMERLFDVAGLPGQDLFRSHDELLAEALERQETRIAYIDEEQAASAAGGKS